MPKKYRGISVSGIDKIINAKKDTTVEGPLVSEFLPDDEVFDENGRRLTVNNGWAARMKQRLESAPYGTGRESLGTICLLCLLGEQDENGSPKYRIEDVMHVGDNTAVKKAEGAKIEALLAPVKDGKPDPEKVKELDILFLRGLQNMCRQMENAFRSAMEQEDLAVLLTPEMSLFASLATTALANIAKDDSLNRNHQVIPGSPLDRATRKEGNDPSVEEIALGKGNSWQSLINQYAPLADLLGDLINIPKDIQVMLDGGRKNMVTVSMTPYATFEQMLARYKQNKKAPLPALLGSKDVKTLQKEFLEGSTTGLQEGRALDLGQLGADTLLSKTSDDEDWSSPENFEHLRKNSSQPLLMEAYMATETDAITRYGAAVLALNGELFQGLKTDLQLKKSKNTRGQDTMEVEATNVTFKKVTRLDMMRAAFLTDIEVPPYRRQLADAEQLQKWADQVRSRMEAVKDLNPPKQYIDDLLTAEKKLETRLAAPINSVADAEELDSLAKAVEAAESDEFDAWAGTDTGIEKELGLKGGEAAARRQGILDKAEAHADRLDETEKKLYDFYRKQALRLEIGERKKIPTNIRTAVQQYKAMLEFGARPAPRSEPLDSAQACKERLDWLAEMKVEVQKAQSHFPGREWKNLREALSQASKAASAIYVRGQMSGTEQDWIAPTASQIEKLNNSLLLLSETAGHYIRHKLKSSSFDKGNDFRRLKLVKRIEGMTHRELEQTAPAVQDSILKDTIREKGLMSKEALKEANQHIGKYAQALLDTQKLQNVSWEFDTMISGIKELLLMQKNLHNKEGALNLEDDRLYFGGKRYNGGIRQALESVNAYVAHKLKTGDNSEISLQRLELTLGLKSYLEGLQQKADSTALDRAAGYAEAEKAAKEAAEAAADHHSRQLKNQAIEQSINEKNRIYFNDLVDETKEDLGKLFIDENGKKTVREVSAEEKPEIVRKVCLLYQYQRFNDAIMRGEKGEAPLPSDRPTIELVNKGRIQELVDYTLEHDKGFQQLMERHFEKAVRKCFSTKDRQDIIRYTQMHNAEKEDPQKQAGNVQANKELKQPVKGRPGLG